MTISHLDKGQSLLRMKASRLAIEGIEQGIDVTHQLHEVYAKLSEVEKLDFGFLFTKHCVDVASRLITRDPAHLACIITRVHDCLLQLSPMELAFGMEKLKNNIGHLFPCSMLQPLMESTHRIETPASVSNKNKP